MDQEVLEEKKYSRKVIISLIIITMLVFSVISISFTAYVKTGQKKESNEENKGNVSMTYTESRQGISLQNASPITDEVGKTLSAPSEYFDFTVTTKVAQDIPITYEIAAVKDPDSTLNDQDIKIYLEKQVSGTYEEVMEPTEFIPSSRTTKIGSPSGSMVLQKITKKRNDTDNYRLRMWVSDKATIHDVKTYAIRINVYGKTM